MAERQPGTYYTDEHGRQRYVTDRAAARAARDSYRQRDTEVGEHEHQCVLAQTYSKTPLGRQHLCWRFESGERYRIPLEFENYDAEATCLSQRNILGGVTQIVYFGDIALRRPGELKFSPVAGVGANMLTLNDYLDDTPCLNFTQETGYLLRSLPFEGINQFPPLDPTTLDPDDSDDEGPPRPRQDLASLRLRASPVSLHNLELRRRIIDPAVLMSLNRIRIGNSGAAADGSADGARRRTEEGRVLPYENRREISTYLTQVKEGPLKRTGGRREKGRKPVRRRKKTVRQPSR
jgi:hypothetical protein